MLSTGTKTCFTVKDVPAQDFIKAYADYLKKNDKIKLPAVNISDCISNSLVDWLRQDRSC